jgi:hypothetical protein
VRGVYTLALMALLSGCSAYTIGDTTGGNTVCIRQITGDNAADIAAVLRQNGQVVNAGCAAPYVDIAITQNRVATAFDNAALASAYRYDYTVLYQWHVGKRVLQNTNRESLALYRTDIGVKQTLNNTALRETMTNRLAERIRLQTRIAPRDETFN